MTRDTFCDKCKAWKPERTHHCSICGKCVMKMDHHCPWVGNCVGYHNYKPFSLFCIFQALTGVIFIMISIDRGYISNETKPSLSYFVSFSFWFKELIDIPIRTSLLFLVYKQILHIY